MSQQTVTIICRNESYICTAPEPRPYKDPAALNWRYQVPGKNYEQLLPNLNAVYQKPRAINWRWQSEHN
jgi:hypothetical protein